MTRLEKSTTRTGWTIIGSAVNHRGVPIYPAEAILRFDGGRMIARAPAEADGGFTLPGGPPSGKVELDLTAPGTARRLLGGDLPPIPENSDWDEKRMIVDLGRVVLGEPCGIAVSLRGAGGAPVTRAQVAINPHLYFEAFPSGFWGDRTLRIEETREEGAYRLGLLPAGKHSIEIEALGCAPFKTQVWLPRQEPLVIELSPGLKIAGTVVGEHGEPLPGAKVNVTLNEVGKFQRRELIAGAEGAFEAKDLVEDIFEVEATAEGHVRGIVDSIPAGTLDLILPLRLGAVVTGRVVRAGGEPVAGARVTVSDSLSDTENPHSNSDAGGRFSVSGVTGGWIEIHSHHPQHGSFESEKLEIARRQHLDAGILVLKPVEAEVEVEVKSEPEVIDPIPGAIRGAVVDTEGRPIACAAVSRGDRYNLGRRRTDAQGVFFIGGLRPDEYFIEVEAEGYCPTSVTVQVASGHIAETRIILNPEGRIAGRLLAGGVPVPGGWVFARLDGYNGREVTVSSVETDGEGRFLLGRLPENTYRIVGEVPRVVSRMKIGVVVESGRTNDVGDLSLEAVPREEISGRVLDGDGQPLSGVWLSVDVDLQKSDTAGSVSDFEGLFRIRGLPALEFRLLARKPGFDFPSMLVSAPTTDLEVILTKLHGLTGRVFDSVSGLPVPRAQVFALPNSDHDSGRCFWLGGWTEQTMTDVQGEFSFDANKHRGQIRHLVVEAESYAIGFARIETIAESKKAFVPLARGIEFNARVIDEQGQPIPEAQACLVDPESAFYRAEFKSGPDGSLVFPKTREGLYRVLLRHPRLGVEEFPVEVRGGAAPAVLTLRGSGALHVLVRKPDGQSPKEAYVSILDVKGLDALGLIKAFQDGEGLIMEIVFDGGRTYTHLPRGRYRLRADDREGEAISPQVEVNLGEEPIEVTLTIP